MVVHEHCLSSAERTQFAFSATAVTGETLVAIYPQTVDMIPKNIDEQTLRFLENLMQDYNISFFEKDISHCELFQKGTNVDIYYNPLIIDTETIMHELLHIWLKQFNYNIGNIIFMFSETHSKLKLIFNKFLCDYIENCFDHYKMYPQYKEMGYSPEKFIKNGHEEQCSIKDITGINFKFLNTYYAKGINLFIGCLISIYADHVERDYSKHLNLLKKKDLELFKIVTEFWNSWKIFDITKNDSSNSDLELSEKFVSEMENWIENKKLK